MEAFETKPDITGTQNSGSNSVKSPSVSASNRRLVPQVPNKSKDKWTRNEDVYSGEPWESIDLDWMSRSDNELQIAVPTTENSQFETKVYKQSITLLIRLQPNETNVSASGYQDPLEVGPWKVPRGSIPVIVGSIAGCCLLLLLGASLAVYMCLHKRQTSYSVKSEASSVVSTRSPKSVHSSSRDSLVLVTGPSSGHQARLLSDPSAANSFLFDYTFDFYFNTPSSHDSCTLKNDLTSPSDFKVDLRKSDVSSGCLLQRSASLIEKTNSQDNPSSISATVQVEVIANCMHSNAERTLSVSKKEEGTVRGDKGCSARSADLALEVPQDLDDSGSFLEAKQMSSDPDTSLALRSQGLRNSCPQDTTSDRNELQIHYRHSFPDEALKTRSLPAWVRSKSRPLASHGDLCASLYGRNDHNFAKRRRNRMGSDAAQVIALSKSRVRLLSPGSTSSVSSSSHLEPPTGTKETGFEEFINDAVIIYNERTAL